jgi:hypothetical protein
VGSRIVTLSRSALGIARTRSIAASPCGSIKTRATSFLSLESLSSQ